jgi:hypothetical protein
MNDKTNATPLIAIKPVWRVLAATCATLLLSGHLLPWAAHTTAALTLSANDLAFFTNFTPGAGIFLNEWFYLPVWVSAVLLAVIGSGLSRSNRALHTALALGVASLGLPRYEQLIKFIRTPTQALRESDFTLQLVLTFVVMGLVILLSVKLTKLTKVLEARQEAKQMNGIVLGLAALICAVPLAGYLGVKPFVAKLYGDAVGIGIGWWLTLLADLLLWAMTFATILNARSAHRTITSHTAKRID